MRHGQNVYQFSKRPWIYPNFNNDNVLLNKEGRNQVSASAKKLKKENIDFIFASDFRRTKQTANIVAKEIKRKVFLDKRLRDINLGIWHGQKKESFFKVFPRFSGKLFDQRPEGGETWQDCQKRMQDFFEELQKNYQGKKILIVSHGDPLWLLEGYIKKYSKKFLLESRINLFLKTGAFKKIS